MRTRRILAATTATAGALALTAAPAVSQTPPSEPEPTQTWEVTVENLTFGQPFSPIAAATHDASQVTFWRAGELAGDGVAAIARDGDPSVAADALVGADGVTDAFVADRPVVPTGVRDDAPFSETSITFEIEGRPGDSLSLSTMLICTNDGFTGVDSIRLWQIPRTVHAGAWDAGVERNTEEAADIVDPCSGLGPVVLDGDPDGNNNDGIGQANLIRRHPNVKADGDLLEAHGWDGPVAKITITPLG